MDMGSVKIAVGLDFEVIDDILKYVYENTNLSAPIDLNIGVDDESLPALDARLLVPKTELKDVNTAPRLGVRINGELSVFGEETTPLTAWIEIIPQVRTAPGEAPKAGLALGGLEEVQPAWFEAALEFLLNENVDDVLSELTLPLYDSLIDQLETSLESPPARDAWSAGFRIGKPGNIDRPTIVPLEIVPPIVTNIEHRPTIPCLLLTLASPGDDPHIPNNRSIVTQGSGLQVIIAQDAMDIVIAAKASAMVGEKIEGATIKSLSLAMHKLGMEVHGSAEKDEADITWDGVMVLHWNRWYTTHSGSLRHWPGGGRISVLTSGVDVDVDLPWWVTLLQVVLVVLGPIGWILHSALLAPKLDEADDAPDLVQNGLSDAVGEAFAEMLGSLSAITEIAPIPMNLYGRDAWVLDGHYVYTSLLMAGHHDATFIDVVEDRFAVNGYEGESVGYFVLDSGHEVSPVEGGELMKDGILRVAGYHGVAAPYGYYIRSNPNETIEDNLVAEPQEIA